jgi:general secretion pathway protein E
MPLGPYISVWKVIPVLLILLVWTRLLTWVDKDSDAAHMARVPINIGLVSGWILAFFLFFILPNFFLAFAVLLVFMIAEAATYLSMRNQKVGLTDLKKQFNDWIASFGRGKGDVKLAADEVAIVGSNGNPIPTPADDAPERAGFDAIQTILTDPLKKNAEMISLAPSEGAAAMQFMVDGVYYNGGSVDRASAASAITILKQAAKLDLNDKRKPQSGDLKVLLNGRRCDLRINTAGSASGEQMTLVTDPKKRHTFKLEELGLTESQLDLVKESIGSGKGISLVAAPTEQGLTTLLYTIIRAHDAFTTHIHTIERDAQQDLEGITQNLLPLNASPADEVKQVSWVVSQEPDAILVTHLTDPKSAAELIKFVGNDRRVYIGIRAGNTFDALAQWRKLVGDDKLAMKYLDYIVAGRVLRKLCMACKVGYAPDPVTLKKLNMDPERVTRLFQARTQPMRDPKGNPIACEFCQELRFKGRTGVYETFPIDDDVRQTVIAGGTINQLKAVFRKQRGKYLQERALDLVEKGETSVQEVLRVLKSSDDSSGSGQRS